MWRLRRVPEIEAGIYARSFKRQKESVPLEHLLSRDPPREEEAPPDDLRDAARKGEIFQEVEPTLTSLARLAASIERSVYQAFARLESRRAARQSSNDQDVIDAAVIDQRPLPRPRPRRPSADETRSIEAAVIDQGSLPRPRPRRPSADETRSIDAPAIDQRPFPRPRPRRPLADKTCSNDKSANECSASDRQPT